MLLFRIHLITACLLLSAFDTHAQTFEESFAAENGMPEFASGRVQLSWDDFKDVLDRLRPPAAKVEKEPEPPVDWVLNSVIYAAEVTEDGRVRVEASMDLLVLTSDRWVTIPVLHESVAPVSLNIDGGSTALTRDAQGWFALMLKGSDPHTFETTFYVTVNESEGKASFEFPTPRAPMTTMTLRIPMPEARVSAPAAARLSATVSLDALVVDLAFKGTDRIGVEWVSPALAEKEPEEVEALIACSTSTMAQVSETYIGVRSMLRFTVLRGAVDTFRLALPLETNVFSVDGPEGLDWRREETDGEQVITVSVNHEVENSFSFNIEYEAPLARDAQSFTIPELRVLDVLRSTGYIAVAAKSNVEFSPGVGMENLSRVDSVDLPPDLVDAAEIPVALIFRYNSTGYTLPLEMVESDPRVASTTETIVNISDTHLALTSHLRFQVLRGVAKTFRVTLPVTVNLLSVDGDGIVWSVQEAGGQQTLTISLDREVSDLYELALRYETPLPEDTATLRVPELAVLDTVRSTGDIAVTVSGNIEITTSTDTGSIRRIDESELPDTLRILSATPILLAFHYNAHGYSLGFETRKLEDVAVQVAVIDEARLTTLITNRGISTTLARYAVRNNERQFLRISLRDGAEILGARVAGKAVKPSRDGETQAVLLPLRKSGPDGAAFPVELIYMEHYPEPDEGRMLLALEAPATDMKVDEFYWDVRIPQSSRLFDIKTDLERIESISDKRRPVTQETEGVRRETVLRFREGIERFLITDINNAGASAMAQSRGYNGRARMPLPESRHDPATVAVAGVMPLRVSLPEGGKVYAFKRLYVPKDTPMSMTVEIGGKSAWVQATVTLAGIGLLLGAMAGAFIRPGRRNRTISAAAVTAMALLSVVAWTWQATYFVLLGFGVGAALSFVVPPIGRFVNRRSKRRESSVRTPPASSQS